MWEQIENKHNGYWCKFAHELVVCGCDNNSILAAMDIGNEALTGELTLTLRRAAYCMAFDYLRARDWLIVRQPFPTTMNGQPVIQMR